MLDRHCLVVVHNAPQCRAEHAHAGANYDKETAFDKYFNSEADYRTRPGVNSDAQTAPCHVYCLAPPPRRNTSRGGLSAGRGPDVGSMQVGQVGWRTADAGRDQIQVGLPPRHFFFDLPSVLVGQVSWRWVEANVGWA